MFLRILFANLCVIALNGCANQAIVFNDGVLYLGKFKHTEFKNENCNYSDVEGVGLILGVTRFSLGAGYFDRKVLIVKKENDVECRSPITDVYIGDSADKSARLFINEMKGRK